MNIPGTLSDMRHAAYWIDRLDQPDLVRLNPETILSLNEQIREKGLIHDVLCMSEHGFLPCGYDVFHEINRTLEDLKRKQMFLFDGTRLSKDDFISLSGGLVTDRMPVGAIPLNQPGRVIRFSDERMIPTDTFLSEKPFDHDFDILQNNGLDIGTPVFLFFTDQTQKWVYQVNPASSGWIKRDHVISFEDFPPKGSTAIVKNAYCPVWRNPDKTGLYGLLRMGNKIEVNPESEEIMSVWLGQSRGFIDAEQLIFQPMPLTQRNVLNDFFQWMHVPYGWGDMNQDVDCSKLIQLVFAKYGLILPRNGVAQGAIKDNLLPVNTENEKEKEKCLIDLGIPGLSLIRFPGHIMLYIGHHDEKAYVIHALYQFFHLQNEEIRRCLPKRVLVSDLTLGKFSQRTSLIERTTHLVNLC